MKPRRRVLDFNVKFPQLEVNPGDFRGGRKLYRVSKNFQTGDVIGDPDQTRKRYIGIMKNSTSEPQINAVALESNEMEEKIKPIENKEMRRDASGMNKWNTSIDVKKDQFMIKSSSVTSNQYESLEQQHNPMNYPDYTSKQPVLFSNQKPIFLREKIKDGLADSAQSSKLHLEREFQNRDQVGNLSESLSYNQSKINRNYRNSREIGNEFRQQPLVRSLELDQKYTMKPSQNNIFPSAQDSTPVYKSTINSSSNIYNAEMQKQRVYTKKNPLVSSSNPITWIQKPSIDHERKLKDYGSLILK